MGIAAQEIVALEIVVLEIVVLEIVVLETAAERDAIAARLDRTPTVKSARAWVMAATVKIAAPMSAAFVACVANRDAERAAFRVDLAGNKVVTTTVPICSPDAWGTMLGTL